MSDREAFLKALAANEDDNEIRMIYADFLEENDEPEEADRMRRWQASKTWMTNWVRSINYGKWEYDEETGDYLEDEKGNRVPAKKDNLGDPHTLQDAIEAGHDAVKGNVYCWATDAGQDFFFEGDYSKGESDHVREWFSHWSTLTGVKVSHLESIVEAPPFRCAC